MPIPSNGTQIFLLIGANFKSNLIYVQRKEMKFTTLSGIF